MEFYCFFFFFCDKETQRKYGEYREMSSSLHVWIRENTLVMQDRQFPNTLIEVKKLAADSNRFRVEEIPHRLREKQHVARLYKDIEVIHQLISFMIKSISNKTNNSMNKSYNSKKIIKSIDNTIKSKN